MTPGTTPTLLGWCSSTIRGWKHASDLACSAGVSTGPVVGELVRVQISCALPLTLVPVSEARAFMYSHGQSHSFDSEPHAGRCDSRELVQPCIALLRHPNALALAVFHTSRKCPSPFAADTLKGKVAGVLRHQERTIRIRGCT